MEGKRRVCHIQKGENGFGFILCCETDTTDTYVLHVLKGSPASKANLEPGDKIIEVNGLNVERESHKEVVERLQGLQSVKLMVVHSNAASDYFRKPGNGMTVRPLENCDESLRPKLITVHKKNDGFDFILQTVGKSKRTEPGRYRQQLRGTVGHFVGSVDKGGVAHAAGLRTGHRLIEINDVNIERECHAFIIAKIRGSSSVDLLVVDEDTDDFFQRHGVAPTAKHLNGHLEFGTVPLAPVKPANVTSASTRPYISPPLLSYEPPTMSRSSDVRRPSRSMSFMKKMTMSTPDLTFGKPKNSDVVSTDLSFFDRFNRRQRTAKAKREIKKQLSKLEKNPRKLTHSQSVLSRSRQLYDDTVISDFDETLEELPEPPIAELNFKRTDDHKKSGPGSTSSTSDYGSNGGTSPTRPPKWQSARPHSVIDTLTAEESPTTSPDKYKRSNDLSSVGYNVDLQTLKRRVHMRAGKSRNGAKAKSQLLDYELAQQFVNAW